MVSIQTNSSSVVIADPPGCNHFIAAVDSEFSGALNCHVPKEVKKQGHQLAGSLPESSSQVVLLSAPYRCLVAEPR